MSVSENFDRKFNKSMRGYNPEEVDAALDALLRYCDELEDANREFEIANNDLIDEKTELNSIITELTEEKEALIKKNAELTENMTRVEGVYNGYREKFGEARDLVTGAKASAAEILARANAKAEILAEEAAKKREETIKELDAEIEKRRALIEKLDISYNKFNADIKTALTNMIDKVDSFHVMPIMPDGLPERKAEAVPAEKNFAPAINKPRRDSEKKIDSVPTPKSPPAVTDEAAISENISEKKAINKEPIPEKKMPAQKSEPEPEARVHNGDSPLGPVWREGSAKENISEVSKMKDSLDEINRKVIEKKSTPHI